VTTLLVAGDRAASEHTGRGTHTGPLAGPTGELPPTGRRFELRSAELYELRGGKVARVRAYYDVATLLRQLGLLA
jgi:predicted ester cyclase